MKLYFYSKERGRNIEVETLNLKTNKFTYQYGTQLVLMDGADKVMKRYAEKIRREFVRKSSRRLM